MFSFRSKSPNLSANEAGQACVGFLHTNTHGWAVQKYFLIAVIIFSATNIVPARFQIALQVHLA